MRTSGPFSTNEFLEVLAARLRTGLAIKEFIILSDLYADVAGFKKKPRERKAMKVSPMTGKVIEKKVTEREPTLDEYIQMLEKQREPKDGQLNPVG